MRLLCLRNLIFNLDYNLNLSSGSGDIPDRHIVNSEVEYTVLQPRENRPGLALAVRGSMEDTNGNADTTLDETEYQVFYRLTCLRRHSELDFKMKIFGFLTAIVFLFAPIASQAAVNSVSPNPSRISIAPKGPTTFNVNWSVVITSPTNGNVIVSSPSALFQVNGTTIATLANTLSQTRALALGSSRDI